MDPWMWWLVVGVALGIAEVTTTFLVFGMFAVGAIGAAVAAGFGANSIVQSVVFVLASAAMLLLVRPVAKRHLRTPPETRTGVAALIGETALVMERVDAHGGRVKIGGDMWSARTLHPEQSFEPGTAVDVIEIKGATALVYGPETP